jgi:hypothetical protein
MSEARAPDAGVIDACAFHEWPSTAALVPFLQGRWGEFVSSIGGRRKGAAMNVKSQWRYQHPTGSKLRAPRGPTPTS